MIKHYIELFNENKNYNNHSGDIYRYDFVINEINDKKHKSIIDISSGRGFLIKRIIDECYNVDITSTDIEKFNNLNVNYIKLDLLKIKYEFFSEKYSLLSCLDVLEHLPEESLYDVFTFFSSLSNKFCFSIANHSDMFNGVELHLIQKDMLWWDKKLSEYFNIINSFTMFNDKLYCYVLEKK